MRKQEESFFFYWQTKQRNENIKAWKAMKKHKYDQRRK